MIIIHFALLSCRVCIVYEVKHLNSIEPPGILWSPAWQGEGTLTVEELDGTGVGVGPEPGAVGASEAEEGVDAELPDIGEGAGGGGAHVP